ncbi:hypothetical protein [Bacillus sp. 1NLA3E]|uniref:hypothetical protein n=1 Tax=Bacillus sp. 1NLA3E TaxID=666686 RepID=UPI000247E65C|nr:hypothetical protein [Bacillus sp. 1NLA3E]AGK52019.1 hypothetical protein B1NLA3E_01175 [Bacillus sp. 1NLA3E]
MAVYSYKEIYDWLNQFPIGQQFVSALGNIIEPGTEVGDLTKVVDTDQIEINIFVFDSINLLEANCVLNSNDKTKNFAKIHVRNIKDIEKKEINLLQYTRDMIGIEKFSDLSLTLTFLNNETIELKQCDFNQSKEVFTETIYKLTK